MQTINVGSMFGANEVNIHVLDKSEQGQETHGFVLSSDKCITTKPFNTLKMEAYCLRVIENKRNEDNPVYLDIVIDYDPHLGIRVASVIATGKNRVEKIRLTMDV